MRIVILITVALTALIVDIGSSASKLKHSPKSVITPNKKHDKQVATPTRRSSSRQVELDHSTTAGKNLGSTAKIKVPDKTLNHEANETKKAMIWPKKMLPRLERILMKKMSGGDDGSDNSYLDNYDGHRLHDDDDSDNNDEDNDDNNASPTSKADYADNYDGVRPKHHHRGTKFNGMDVVPLMKMLRHKFGESSPYDSNGFTGMPATQNNKFLLKTLMNQALGKPDRGSVLKDMMQEFYLAKGNDKEGDEAREALDELVGHNNLLRMNSELEGQTASVDVGPTDNTNSFTGGEGRGGVRAMNGDMNGAINGAMNVQNDATPILRNTGTAGRFGASPFGGTGVLEAQELPNGQIAPLGARRPGMGLMNNIQPMMNRVANPTTRMLQDDRLPQQQMPEEPVFDEPAAVPIGASTVQAEPEAEPEQIAAAMRQQSDSKPGNQLVLEEEPENAARGIKPPPFASLQDQAAREMKLGANFRAPPTYGPFRNPGFQRAQMANQMDQNELVTDTEQRFETASPLTESQSFPGEYTFQQNTARRHELPKHITKVTISEKTRLGRKKDHTHKSHRKQVL
ncbi:uncharacterized protein LOC116620044 isoform X1 [Nematostella vectensis]|uniref:uncharacterized protein LOC116620044 isoform X1 n=1 Tax=Nematostella vectensis TaxID=45351 RepID=UPI00138FF7AE|nr:uncharacterized protein LOC116620044 isoform X1 [Nematostella vectensis]